jgi:hypothetical protein
MLEIRKVSIGLKREIVFALVSDDLEGVNDVVIRKVIRQNKPFLKNGGKVVVRTKSVVEINRSFFEGYNFIKNSNDIQIKVAEKETIGADTW